VFPICPGVVAGEFDPDQYVFLNFGVEEVIADLNAFLQEVWTVNPGLRIVFTVSPVSLAATAEPKHVWTASTYSKSVLRVAAEALSRLPNVAYFPAYEVITSPASRGAYLDDDLRTVTKEGVDHVMRLFFRHVGVSGHQSAPSITQPRIHSGDLQIAKAMVETMCDESRLDLS
jgi:hypothetical protein